MLNPTKEVVNKQSKGIKIGIIALALISGGVITYQTVTSRLSTTPVESIPPSNEVKVDTVTALGRLEPVEEVIQVSAPGGASGQTIEELLVKEGDKLKKGEIIAILDNNSLRKAALMQAEAQLRVAEARLAQVEAGAQTGEISAQRATIDRIIVESQNNIRAQTAQVEKLKAELKNAQIEYQRYNQLYQDGAIAASERDSKKLRLDTTERQLEEAEATLERIKSGSRKQIEEAEATLNRIAEVRPVDVNIAAAEVKQAEAAINQAQAELELTYIKAPITGEIIDILSRPGEEIGNTGIVRMGQTEQMYAIAEIYESDIKKVKVGQNATITSSALEETLSGVVETVGLEVKRQEVINTDPAANIDAKIVEVKIRLNPESSQKVSSLTNLLVKVKIDI